MSSASKNSKRALGVLAGSAAFALALVGCAPSGGGNGNAADSLIVVQPTRSLSLTRLVLMTTGHSRS